MPLGRGHLQKGFLWSNRSVVDEDVYAPGLGQHLLGELFGTVPTPEVRFEDQNLAAASLDIGAGLIKIGTLARGDGHARTGLGKTCSYVPAYPAPASGYERGLSSEVEEFGAFHARRLNL